MTTTAPPPFAPKQTQEPGWWRRNRGWLLAVPLAIAVFVIGSASRLHEFWWAAGPHEQVASGRLGEVIAVEINGAPRFDEPPKQFQLALTALEDDAAWIDSFTEEPVVPPDGVRAVAARLDFADAEPADLASCTVALLDADGNRYLVDDGNTDHIYQCVPEEVSELLGDQETGDDVRLPASWSTAPVFLVPEDARITTLQLYWETALPEYVELELPH